jgi:uncharacterized membrane protein YbhN (UPF0104 family)
MPESSTGSSPARRYAPIALKLTVSVAVLVFLFSRMDAAHLWAIARRASLPWLGAALAVYYANVLASAWRWRLLLDAQQVHLPMSRLLRSFLVANFFNNFLPSNIGGDVVRIRDTAGPAGSKTLATTVVLVDRGLGLMGLVLVSAMGASLAAGLDGSGSAPIWPLWLWGLFALGAAVSAPAVYAPEGLGRLLQPLTIVHPEWVGERIDTFTSALGRFRERLGALAGCFAGALFVQGLMVVFYLALVHALHIPISIWDLAVVVPLSLVVQMAPLSLNGLGLREATFSFYFARLGLPIESAVVLSLVGAGLTMLASLTGAAVYLSNRH